MKTLSYFMGLSLLAQCMNVESPKNTTTTKFVKVSLSKKQKNVRTKNKAAAQSRKNNRKQQKK